MAGKKQRDTAAEEEELKARKLELAERDKTKAEDKKEPAEQHEPTDLLAAEGEEDVIF